MLLPYTFFEDIDHLLLLSTYKVQCIMHCRIMDHASFSLYFEIMLVYFYSALYTKRLSAFRLYDKCPKILYTKGSDKMAYANSADPEQTEGAV